MIFVGMDIHDKSTTVCFFDPEAAPVAQHRYATCPTTAKDLTALLRPFGGDCQIAYEVGTQAQWVAGILRPLAEEVQVANPGQIRWLYRSGRKNDRLDAKKLATLLYLGQLPTVHLPSADVSAWRALINHRRTLVNRRTMVKNQIRAILRAFAARCPYRSCWSVRGVLWLRSQTFDAARDLMRDTLLAEMDFITGQLRHVERQLDAIARTQSNVALIRTIPGIGPRTAEAIVAFADQVGRFKHRKAFACYFGMTPTQDASGGRDHHGHISKQGPSVVRWVLTEAAHQTVRRCRALKDFYRRVHQGRKDRSKRAIVATGRKILTLAFAMMRDQTVFDPSRVTASAA